MKMNYDMIFLKKTGFLTWWKWWRIHGSERLLLLKTCWYCVLYITLHCHRLTNNFFAFSNLYQFLQNPGFTSPVSIKMQETGLFPILWKTLFFLMYVTWIIVLFYINKIEQEHKQSNSVNQNTLAYSMQL